MTRRFLLVSDFDQTLSFNDSGIVLSELLGASDFEKKVVGLSRLNLVQQGGELAYLLRHDPEYRRVRRDDLVEAGRRIRLKKNIKALTQFLASGIPGYAFDMYVVSAAPEEVIQSALRDILPPDHIIATRFEYDRAGEIESIAGVRAGYGKVAAVDELRATHGIPRDRIVYVGDGSSDVHVMLHVNRGHGLTIAVSEAKYITEIAARTVISDDALSILIPILEDIVGYGTSQIRALFEDLGFLVHEWEKVRTDWVTILQAGYVASMTTSVTSSAAG